MSHTLQGEALRCPVCSSVSIEDCIRISNTPIHCNVLYNSRQVALEAARGDIHLVFCQTCGHLFNSLFDPGRVDYTGEYENSLFYSERFRAYASSLANRLIDLHDLRGKTIMEIACGRGDFLRLLCSLGENHGVGFDPSQAAARGAIPADADIVFVQDYYSEDYTEIKADLICCRHALEHMPRPGEFLRMLRRTIGSYPSALFFEVPSASFMLKDLAIWDLIYEHCGYFWEGSLAEIFRRSGFAVDSVQSEFGDQFVSVNASPGSMADAAFHGDALRTLTGQVRLFSRHFFAKSERWGRLLNRLRERGRKTVLWGAGSKGISFLNSMDAGKGIAFLVDLNPLKIGHFVAGTGHEICAPEVLIQYQPDTVLVMNPLYTDEIRRTLSSMGVACELLVDGSEYVD